MGAGASCHLLCRNKSVKKKDEGRCQREARRTATKEGREGLYHRFGIHGGGLEGGPNGSGADSVLSEEEKKLGKEEEEELVKRSKCCREERERTTRIPLLRSWFERHRVMETWAPLVMA